MYHGVSASARRLQRPIRHRGCDRKKEYQPPRILGSADLVLTERMEHMHPHKTTTAHPFPLGEEQHSWPIFLPPSTVPQLHTGNSLLDAYTSSYPLLDGPTPQTLHPTMTLFGTPESFRSL